MDINVNRTYICLYSFKFFVLSASTEHFFSFQVETLSPAGKQSWTILIIQMMINFT